MEGIRRRSDSSSDLPKLYDIFPCEVATIQQYGVFVKIPGYRKNGLVHKSQMSKSHVEDPSEMVEPKEQIYCKVISIDPDTEKIGMSMKVVNQTTGQDLDPGHVQTSLDEQRRKTGHVREIPRIHLGAVLDTTCKKCGGKGHLANDCFHQPGAKTYELLPDLEFMAKQEQQQKLVDAVAKKAKKEKKKEKKMKKRAKKEKKKLKKKAKKRKDRSSDTESDSEDVSHKTKKIKKKKKAKYSSSSSESGSSSESSSESDHPSPKRKRKLSEPSHTGGSRYSEDKQSFGSRRKDSISRSNPDRHDKYGTDHSPDKKHRHSSEGSPGKNYRSRSSSDSKYRSTDVASSHQSRSDSSVIHRSHDHRSHDLDSSERDRHTSGKDHARHKEDYFERDRKISNTDPDSRGDKRRDSREYDKTKEERYKDEKRSRDTVTHRGDRSIERKDTDAKYRGDRDSQHSRERYRH